MSFSNLHNVGNSRKHRRTQSNNGIVYIHENEKSLHDEKLFTVINIIAVSRAQQCKCSMTYERSIIIS